MEESSISVALNALHTIKNVTTAIRNITLNLFAFLNRKKQPKRGNSVAAILPSPLPNPAEYKPILATTDNDRGVYSRQVLIAVNINNFANDFRPQQFEFNGNGA